jgi:hypothetical protein
MSAASSESNCRQSKKQAEAKEGMASSGMLRHVALVRAVVTEELGASVASYG